MAGLNWAHACARCRKCDANSDCLKVECSKHEPGYATVRCICSLAAHTTLMHQPCASLLQSAGCRGAIGKRPTHTLLYRLHHRTLRRSLLAGVHQGQEVLRQHAHYIHCGVLRLWQGRPGVRRQQVSVLSATLCRHLIGALIEQLATVNDCAEAASEQLPRLWTPSD